MDSNKSRVWKYFSRNARNEDATCNTCQKNIKCKGGCTSGMFNHLKLKHNIDIKKNEKSAETEVVVKQIKLENNNILNFLRRESLSELLAKCVAYDGFSIQAISKSSAIKEFVGNRGYRMPQSETTIKSMIIKFYNEKQLELKAQLTKLKESGSRFSITVDEWTNTRMKRFLNVTLHGNDGVYNLGLTYIQDRCNATEIYKMVQIKLLQFGIEMEHDIVASTHDGAAVMKKYGSLNGIDNQLCYNHAIHLAIMDVFYRKNNHTIANIDECSSIIDSESESDFDSNENNNKRFDEKNCFNSDLNLNFVSENNDNSNYQFRRDFNDTLKECRRIVRFFKYSPVKNSILQSYILEQEKKELKLLLDCKTRWNSIIPMVERLLKVINCVKKATEDITGNKSMFNIDFEQIQNLIEILKMVELSVNELSKNNITILASEGILKFLFRKLHDLNSPISLDLSSALEKRLTERRQKTLITLFAYLNSGSIPRSDDFFQYTSKPVTICYAKNLLERLNLIIKNYDNNCDDFVPSSDMLQTTLQSSQIQLSLVEEMQASISSFTESQSQKKPETDILQKEFEILESTGRRTGNLENLIRALGTMQPTSTSSERVFSIANNFSTKIRSSMKPELINALVFLKFYFLKKQ